MGDVPASRRSRKGLLSSPCRLIYSARDELENLVDELTNDLYRCLVDHEQVTADFKFRRDGIEEALEVARGEVAVFDDALGALGVKV